MASVELEFKDTSATTGVVEAESAAAENLVLGAGVAQETGRPLGGARALASVELESEVKSAAAGS